MVAVTWYVLLVILALHLLHHRLAKRHISFAEVITAGVLVIPPAVAPVPLLVAHVALSIVQVIGSLWIERLSPSWERT